MLFPEEVADILKKVTFGPAFPWKVKLASEWDVRTKAHLVLIVVTVKDRTTGTPTRVVSQEEYRSQTVEDFLAELRRHLTEFLIHELDESLLFNGILLNDPHKDE